MKVEGLNGGEFVGIVSGLRLTGAAPPAVAAQLQEALDTYSVLLIREAGLSDEGLVEFGRSFGALQEFMFGASANKQVSNLSNLGADKQIRSADDPIRAAIAADGLWHTDSTYLPSRARYSMLVARTLPKTGGGTDFCDTRGAYDALPDDLKAELEGKVAFHSIIHSRTLCGFHQWTPEQRAALPPVPQPLIWQNPRTLRRSVYLASHIFEIEGMPPDRTRQVLAQLNDIATAPRFVYAHKWTVGDLVIWDNRATMHRRAPYDDLTEVRQMSSIRVIEPSPLYDPSKSYGSNPAYLAPAA
jgi:alpha-ketoglutarate-dependent 2,4-dichlorophenoxyacetate dioxygenase